MMKSKKTKTQNVVSIRTQFTRSAIALAVSALAVGEASAVATGLTISGTVAVVDSVGAVTFTPSNIAAAGKKLTIEIDGTGAGGDRKAVLNWDSLTVHADDIVDFASPGGIYLNKATGAGA